MPSDPAAKSVADAAVTDLASRLKVPPETIRIMKVEEVTWSDGALGCPKPGESYTQALVDGYRVVLGQDERVYVYHAGSDGKPQLCPNRDSEDGGYEFVPPPGFDD